MSATPLSLTPSRINSAEPSGYIGRFAPSPTGPLHFGSLVSALASYLDAKANGGQWLVRMEDLDPPREQPGAASAILRSLYHSPASGQICSLRLKLYDLPGHQSDDIIQFEDLIQGTQIQNLRTGAGDQILKRRDGFYAYQLAVVVDDIAQGITHIIRGSDLLEVTGRQLFFFGLLGAPMPQFGHVPLAVQANGQKLSKQNHAKAIDGKLASRNLWRGLEFLGQNPPAGLADASTSELLDWALHHWQRQAVHGLSHLYQEE
jgi:glutamyl-Q tRNA(Asp) synthetase